MTNIETILSKAIERLATISDTASLDAEILLCHTIDKPRSHLRAWPKKELSHQDQSQFLDRLEKRLQGVPIAYITGTREFWSRDFKVNSDVLIPRPDTELLIEISLNLIANKASPQLIDLGTGSGIIAITLAAERPDINITATDLSENALKVARHNAAIHKIENIQFSQSCWFDNLIQSKFDLVISNPPYIDKNDPHLLQGDVRFEPKSALTAAEKGLKDIKTISHDAQKFLKPGASLLIEHGFDQQSAVQAIFSSFSYHNIKTHKDLSGNPRVTTGQWNPS